MTKNDPLEHFRGAELWLDNNRPWRIMIGYRDRTTNLAICEMHQEAVPGDGEEAMGQAIVDLVNQAIKADEKALNPAAARHALERIANINNGPDKGSGEWRASAAAAIADEALKTFPVELKERPYQDQVFRWLLACFGEAIARDKTERSHRFLEEALELVQAAGTTASEAHQLVDYVFGRPAGELHQEVGGVMVCLASLCSALDIDMNRASGDELARVWTKMETIRAKHAAKPQFSPLPGEAA